MNCSALVLAAWMLVWQSSLADEGATVPLPPGSLVPEVAQNAGDAPRWNPPAAATQQLITQPAQAQPTTSQSAPAQQQAAQPASAVTPQNIPAQTATAIRPGVSPTSAATTPPGLLPSGLNSGSSQARPLQSVMKRKPVAAAATAPPIVSEPAASPVVPAQYQQPIARPAEIAAQASSREAAAVSPPTAFNVLTNNRRPSTSENLSKADENVVIGNPDVAGSNLGTLRPAETPVQLVPPPTSAVEKVDNPETVTDPRVVPTADQTFESNLDRQQLAAAHAASDLLAPSLTPGAPSELTGRWAPLSSVIANVDEHQRLPAVSAYWRLSRATSDYFWALDEQDRLEKAAPSNGLIKNPMLSTAQATATAHVHEAQLEVTQAQQALLSLTGTTGVAADGGILPSDRPLVGPYRTYYETIFANRSPTGRTWEINAALPIQLKVISDRAAAVRSAMDAVHFAEEAHARGEADMRTVIACHEDLHRQRRDFLNAVLNYNLDIGEYAVAVAAPGTPQDKFVAMLIKPKPTERLTAVPERPTFEGVVTPSIRHESRDERGAKKTDSRNSQSNDGWVPTAQHAVEVGPPAAVEERARETAPADTQTSPLGRQADPFAPNVGDRYGNRYNTDGR
jgi:hypothetical protein